MVNYIADSLHRISQLPPKAATSPAMSSYLGGLRPFAAKLSEYEVFAFSPSAMRAASDIRIDTPDRIDRIVEAVLHTPRRVFLECDVASRDGAMQGLRGFFGHIQASRYPARRFGVFVDILGEGRATIQPVWMHDKVVAKSSERLVAAHKQISELRGGLSSRVSESLLLAASPTIGSIDLKKHVGISKAEFDMATAHAAKGFDPLLDRGRQEASEAPSKTAENAVWARYWRMMRFRDIVRSETTDDPMPGPIGAAVRDLYPEAMFEPLEEGLHVIAMLALLEVDSSDFGREYRKKVLGKRQGTGNPKVIHSSENAEERLSIVSMNIQDRGLQQLYDEGAGVGSSASPTGQSYSHDGRARHPVRGHLFLARNGKMTWRVPHWRGSVEASVIHRVTAPSYNS
jgi:hypothetical protein